MIKLWCVLALLCCFNFADNNLREKLPEETSEEFIPVQNNSNFDRPEYVESSNEFVTVVTKISEGTTFFSIEKSPYILKNDIIVGKGSKLIIQAGVVVKSYPGVGIYVKGILQAKGQENFPIVLTSLNASSEPVPFVRRKIRLVDGPSVATGRLQILFHTEWQSVCTNSRQWTQKDFDTACKQLGFRGGKLWKWLPREDGVKPRFLYDSPQCTGTEESLFNCSWSSRIRGGGICDGHPDVGIQCIEQYSSAFDDKKHWKGLQFDNTEFEFVQREDTTQTEHKSYSVLEFTEIRYGGVGYNHRAISALEITGAPPEMKAVHVTHSAYNGISINMPTAPVRLTNCQASNNRGYGIYINTYSEPIALMSCSIMNNSGDGVKFVRQEKTRTELLNDIRFKNLCSLSESDNQTYPIYIKAISDQHSISDQNCFKILKTVPGQVFTLSFLEMWSEYLNQQSPVIQVFDGAYQNETLLATVKIMNGVKVQNIVSTSNILGIQLKTMPGIKTSVFMKLTSSNEKYYSFLSKYTTSGGNDGHGISMENPLGIISLQDSLFSNNSITGVTVSHGMAEINFVKSYALYNTGNGISLLHLRGKTTVINSVISHNRWHGIVIHPRINEFSQMSYNETVDVKDTHISNNDEYGLLIEYVCGYSSVSISENTFHKNGNKALKITSCAAIGHGVLNLQVDHNKFLENQRLGVHIEPAVNIKGVIEHNNFSSNAHGCMLIRNHADTGLESFPTDIKVNDNIFELNKGNFVVNFALSPYSNIQTMIFTRNYLKNNVINEPFQQEGLIPRNKVAAVVIINSCNVITLLNVIENPLSTYEIGTHLTDHNGVINCTYNWLGYKEDKKIFPRIFDRSKRYNLAQLEYFPILQNSVPENKGILSNGIYRQDFRIPGSNLIGGEVDGRLYLRKGEYIVYRDIHVLPGSKLVLEPGVTLRFPPSIGALISGQLEAIGKKNNEILFTLNTTEAATFNPKVQLIGGKTKLEGLLQVYIGDQWGTVCNKGWSMADAAVVCHSMGLILNPDDWFLKIKDIPETLNLVPIFLSNVQCNEDDVDILKCKSEGISDFENSCTHEHDVGVRCYEPAWAGIRFGLLAEGSDLQFVTVEKAGLFDYSTHSLTAAIKIDFSHHLINNTRVINNIHHGLEIVYTDIFSEGMNIVENSTFENNGGNGIYMHQMGFTISGSTLKNNKMAGIHYNPSLKHYQETELATWSKIQPSQNKNTNAKDTSILIPEHQKDTIFIRTEETIFIVTRKLGTELSWLLQIECEGTHFIAVQVLNPIKRKSTEEIVIYDNSNNSNGSRYWRISDMMRLTVITMSSEVLLQYENGNNGLGDAILAISTVPAFLHENMKGRLEDPVTTLTVTNTLITGNKNALRASYFRRCQNENDISLSKMRESITLSFCVLSYSKEEVIYVDSPALDDCQSNKINVTFNISQAYITHNAKGIHHHSRIHESSDSVFLWIIRASLISYNEGAFELNLPYKRQQNAALFHTVSLIDSEWSNNRNFGLHIYGGFAHLNITKNLFLSNLCTTGLISLQGMEKDITIFYNRVADNYGIYMFEFHINSQAEAIERAAFFRNQLEGNYYFSDSCEDVNKDYGRLSSLIKFRGLQKVTINRNLFINNSLQFNIIAGIETRKVNDLINAKENWWGSEVASHIMQSIFDFDDWNNYILVEFRPYLKRGFYDAQLSDPKEKLEMNLNNIGGRLFGNMTLKARKEPYIIQHDLTVMPNATLIIEENSVLQFAPNVGILVLGSLKAMGRKGKEILMLPLQSEAKKCRKQMTVYHQSDLQTVRLCTELKCSSNTGNTRVNEGFLEVYDTTKKLWFPQCDPDFTIKNAEVVCRELGFSSLGAFIEYHWSTAYSGDTDLPWPAAHNCSGDEARYQDCPHETNITGYVCVPESLFVYIHCKRNEVDTMINYWGGIRFARSEFEMHHDNQNHSISKNVRTSNGSFMQYVKILHAGSLHKKKSPGIQMIFHSATVHKTSITSCISDGIHVVSSVHDIQLFQNRIESVEGVGIAITSLGIHDKGSEDSNLPTLFGVLNICDAIKVVNVAENVFLHFKYENSYKVCLKIFRSLDRNKTLGIRFLNVNQSRLIEEGSFILYDGDIRQTSATLMLPISGTSAVFSSGIHLSIKLISSKYTRAKEFTAEVFTVPVSVDTFENYVQYNITSCIVRNNFGGGITVSGPNQEIHMEQNQITGSCNPSKTMNNCKAAVTIDVQDSKSVVFKDNLVKNNQGGLLIHAISTSSTTTTTGWITNNLFSENTKYPALHVKGSETDKNQEIKILRNYFTENQAPKEGIIIISKMNTNFSYNIVTRNTGTYILKLPGNKKMHPEEHSVATNNYFYMNRAESTILAGTPGLQFSDNMMLNPENIYEIASVSISFFDYTIMPVDARNNWWGLSNTKDVMNRVYDNSVDSSLLPVTYIPFYTNENITEQKCILIKNRDADYCLVPIVVPVTFAEANKFCELLNSSLAHMLHEPLLLHHVMKEELHYYYHHTAKMWVRYAKFANKCTTFFNQTVQSESCQELHPFICISNYSDDQSIFKGPQNNWNTCTRIFIITVIIMVFGLLCTFIKFKIIHFFRMQDRRQEATTECQEMSTFRTHDSFVDVSLDNNDEKEAISVHGSESVDDNINTANYANDDTNDSTNISPEFKGTADADATKASYL